MDVDNDNFYDEISSFMPQPCDYSLDDLDEIIRSTDSHLDSSLDLNVFSNRNNQNDFDMGNTMAMATDQIFPDPFSDVDLQLKQSLKYEQNDFEFNFSAFPSPATSHQSSGDYVSPFETPDRTSSTSSVDDDHINPDDFINFLNDEDVKFEDLTQDTIRKLHEHMERNTPSPSGSCTSSSGSSTSGIQSDVSSVASMPHNIQFTLAQEQDQDDLSEFITFKNEKTEANEIDANKISTAAYLQNDETFIMPTSPASSEIQTSTIVANPTLLPITVPVLPGGAIQPLSSANILPGTIIPVQTVPLTAITTVTNIKTPAAIRHDTKTVVKPLQGPLKVVPPAANNAAKATTPSNPKPKTIFLSSNDFKALMQKVNTNGTATGKKVNTPNGQTPKVIMKTASGKFITANKITSVNQTSTAASNSNSTQASSGSKLAHASGPMLIKHQPSKVITTNSRSAAAMAAAARATMSHSKGCRTDLNMFRSLGDDKVIKKQMRMLKNRESASLSRKKKKEYVERLENRISNLERENYSLKGENTSLRSQLMAFAKTCNCKNGNVSEFILNTLSMSGKKGKGAKVLNAIDASFLLNDASSHSADCPHGSSRTETTRQHIKIAPKPLNASSSINKSFRHRMNASTVKKNVAVLFAMAFMVTLNVGNFQTYLNKSALENAMEEATAGNVNEAEPLVVSPGRRLLWVPNEHEFHEQHNRSKREADIANMSPPPLHFLRPVNRTTADKLNGTSTKDEPPIKDLPSIKYGPTVYDNGTKYAQENMRLARNLHKWIGGNDFLNLTGSGNDIGRIATAHFKLDSDSDYMDYDLQIPVGMKQKRKISLGSSGEESITGKQPKFDMEAGKQNSLDIFQPRISEEYLRLFKGIKRQDDTFYVLSFNMDHILLPASAYNKSSRPKMSLMLPARDPSLNGDIVLMQIDCEVLNTTELEIKSHMIPEKLRPLKYGPNVHVNPNDVVNNETKAERDAKADAIHLRKEESTKEKPSAPRTYFTMGPKNQPSPVNKVVAASPENVVKKRPTIVKFNANDSVIGSGVLNVRNSTLFTRMKETVVNGGANTNGFVASAGSEIRKII